MSDAEHLSIETLRVLAIKAGIELSDDDLHELRPAVMRNQERAKSLRKWVKPTTEPAVNSLVPRSQGHVGT